MLVTPRHLAGIIGWPVERSLSPAIHAAAYEALGLEWAYLRLAVRPGAIADGITLLRALDVRGANVTVPHKEAIVPFLDELVGDAAACRAVNTVVRREGGFLGHNTDGEGFLRALREDRFDPVGTSALVLGAGGAARGVALALRRAGAAVAVSARRPDAAATLAADIDGVTVVPWGRSAAAALVVNATSARESLPVEAVLEGAVAVADLIYLPPETELLAAARARGIPAWDGLGMLVHQAALSFALWTGVEPPIDVMRAAAMRTRTVVSPA